MDSGLDFLKSQVNNAVMQHDTLLRGLVDHESQAKDQRFRDLCSRHIANAREDQRLLEQFQQQLGAHEGVVKKAFGAAAGVVRDLADAPRDSDFLRLVGDIVMARQSEDTFKTFREAGRELGIEALAKIGEVGEKHQDAYVHEANRLAQQLFVDHARGAESALTAARAPSIDIRA